MADKLIFIPNDDTQIYPFCRLQLVVERLHTQLNEQTNQNSIVPKVVKPQIRNIIKNSALGVSVINSPIRVFIYVDKQDRKS